MEENYQPNLLDLKILKTLHDLPGGMFWRDIQERFPAIAQGSGKTFASMIKDVSDVRNHLLKIGAVESIIDTKPYFFYHSSGSQQCQAKIAHQMKSLKQPLVTPTPSAKPATTTTSTTTSTSYASKATASTTTSSTQTKTTTATTTTSTPSKSTTTTTVTPSKASTTATTKTTTTTTPTTKTTATTATPTPKTTTTTTLSTAKSTTTSSAPKSPRKSSNEYSTSANIVLPPLINTAGDGVEEEILLKTLEKFIELFKNIKRTEMRYSEFISNYWSSIAPMDRSSEQSIANKTKMKMGEFISKIGYLCKSSAYMKGREPIVYEQKGESDRWIRLQYNGPIPWHQWKDHLAKLKKDHNGPKITYNTNGSQNNINGNHINVDTTPTTALTNGSSMKSNIKESEIQQQTHDVVSLQGRYGDPIVPIRKISPTLLQHHLPLNLGHSIINQSANSIISPLHSQQQQQPLLPSVEVSLVSNSRVVSNNNNNNNNNNKINNEYEKFLIEQLTCLSCHTLMSPPIFQCSTGHSICNTCYNKTTICPQCNEEWNRNQKIRSHLEKLSLEMKIKCNRPNCNFMGTTEEIINHQYLNCQFTYWKCCFCSSAIASSPISPSIVNNNTVIFNNQAMLIAHFWKAHNCSILNIDPKINEEMELLKNSNVLIPKDPRVTYSFAIDSDLNITTIHEDKDTSSTINRKRNFVFQLHDIWFLLAINTTTNGSLTLSLIPLIKDVKNTDYKYFKLTLVDAKCIYSVTYKGPIIPFTGDEKMNMNYDHGITISGKDVIHLTKVNWFMVTIQLKTYLKWLSGS